MTNRNRTNLSLAVKFSMPVMAYMGSDSETAIGITVDTRQSWYQPCTGHHRLRALCSRIKFDAGIGSTAREIRHLDEKIGELRMFNKAFYLTTVLLVFSSLARAGSFEFSHAESTGDVPSVQQENNKEVSSRPEATTRSEQSREHLLKELHGSPFLKEWKSDCQKEKDGTIRRTILVVGKKKMHVFDYVFKTAEECAKSVNDIYFNSANYQKNLNSIDSWAVKESEASVSKGVVTLPVARLYDFSDKEAIHGNIIFDGKNFRVESEASYLNAAYRQRIANQ